LQKKRLFEYYSLLETAWSLIALGDVTIDEAVDYAKQSFFSGCNNETNSCYQYPLPYLASWWWILWASLCLRYA